MTGVSGYTRHFTTRWGGFTLLEHLIDVIEHFFSYFAFNRGMINNPCHKIYTRWIYIGLYLHIFSNFVFLFVVNIFSFLFDEIIMRLQV